MRDTRATLQFSGFQRAAAVCAAAVALVAGCGQDGAVKHPTVGGRTYDVPTRGVKLEVTLDGKALDLPGEAKCSAVGGIVNSMSKADETKPSAVLVVEQTGAEAKMVTIATGDGTRYAWSPELSKQGNATASKSGDTYTVSGTIPQKAPEGSAGSLHPFKVELTCPGIK